MIILCKLAVVVMVGSIPFGTTAQVEGKVINKTNSSYIANFEPYLRKAYPKVANPESYSKFLVSKDSCGELNE